jgi:hypothetical protein
VEKRILLSSVLLACLTSSTAALAQFAEPPDQPIIARGNDPEPLRDSYDRDANDYYYLPRSTLRLNVGPALRVSENSPDGGLSAALDIGERAAGVRLSGAWVRVGGNHGLQQYGGELWIDFGEGKRLHPILGAGAAVARLDRQDPVTGDLETSTLGVGVLRGTLQYLLPVPSTDARAGIDVIGSVPAIRGSDDAPSSPWLLIVATVGVGF